jgi:hypothetical protein
MRREHLPNWPNQWRHSKLGSATCDVEKQAPVGIGSLQIGDLLQLLGGNRKQHSNGNSARE